MSNFNDAGFFTKCLFIKFSRTMFFNCFTLELHTSSFRKTTFSDLWVLNGRIEDSERMDTTCNRVWFSYLHLHGLLMALAWGILLPLGALIARYYKNYNSKIWLILHVSLQVRRIWLFGKGILNTVLVTYM